MDTSNATPIFQFSIDFVDSIKESLGGALENTDIAQSVQDLGQNATDQVSEVTDQASQTVQDATEQAGQSIEEVKNQ